MALPHIFLASRNESPWRPHPEGPLCPAAGMGFTLQVMDGQPEEVGVKVNKFSPVQSLSHVRLFVTPWTTASQASLSITNYQNLPKPMSIESVMPSNHLILCHPLLLLPSIFPTIRVFSNKWPKYQNFSFNISPSNTQDWSPLGWTGCISLQSKGLSWVFSNTTVQKHQFFGSTQSTQSPNHWSTREFLTRFFS